MVIAGPVLGQAVAANQVVVSGQYEVNGTFGNIISLLFAMIPVIYIAGLVTLVGLQARTASDGWERWWRRHVTNKGRDQPFKHTIEGE